MLDLDVFSWEWSATEEGEYLRKYYEDMVHLPSQMFLMEYFINYDILYRLQAMAHLV